jgi:hypothetical protein
MMRPVIPDTTKQPTGILALLFTRGFTNTLTLLCTFSTFSILSSR